MLQELANTDFKFVADEIQRQQLSENAMKRKKGYKSLIKKVKGDSLFIPLMPLEYYPLNQFLFINGEEIQGVKYPFLVKVHKKNFTEPVLFKNQMTKEDEQEMKKLPKAIRKFYLKRNFLFSKFQEGIQLDQESYYSVIPEVIAQYLAQTIWERVRQLNMKDVEIVDPFCGCGGLSIQLSLKFDKVFPSDIDETQYKYPLFKHKIINLQNNAIIYNSELKAKQMNFFDINSAFTEKKDSRILILCPPWGGTKYLKKHYYDLETDMDPKFSSILKKAFEISDNLLIQLPRNIKLKQAITIFQEVLPQHYKRNSLEIVLIYINEQINQIFLIYGDISIINYSIEMDYLYKILQIGNKKKKKTIIIQLDSKEEKNLLKQSLKNEGPRNVYGELKIIDDFDEELIEHQQIEENNKQNQPAYIKKKIKKNKKSKNIKKSYSNIIKFDDI